MREHLAGIAREAAAIVGERATVLDVGCNDGTLLRAYPSGYELFGIDPSDVAQEAAEGGVTVVRDTFPSVELDALLGGKKLDVVTSIAMFYDLEDPVAFAKAVARVLAPEGVWVFEMSYMPTMLVNTSYDTLCHEHLEYYSFSVLQRILAEAGLKVLGASLNDVNGGSIRVIATHRSNFRIDLPELRASAKAIHLAEFDLELDTDKPYRHFQDRVNVHREELSRLLRQWKREGKRVHVYGASTKGNTILQWCGIDNRLVDVAAERNPQKYGASTLGTDIPIVSEAESRAMRPDYYLVLPWHFRAEIVERERDTLAAGTALVFPLPHIDIVRAP
jgi:SAM-dependent methyltransferase